MKRIFLCNWFFIAKCIGDYVLDFVLVNVLLAGCWLYSKGIKTSSKKQPQKSWTTLFTTPFINHFREWAHFIYYPFINHFSTLFIQAYHQDCLAKLQAYRQHFVGLEAPTRGKTFIEWIVNRTWCWPKRKPVPCLSKQISDYFVDLF